MTVKKYAPPALYVKFCQYGFFKKKKKKKQALTECEAFYPARSSSFSELNTVVSTYFNNKICKHLNSYRVAK